MTYKRGRESPFNHKPSENRATQPGGSSIEEPQMNKTITKQGILKTIRQFARKHKRNPKVCDLEALGITRTIFLRHWGSMRKGLTAAGLAVAGIGFPQMDSTVL